MVDTKITDDERFVIFTGFIRLDCVDGNYFTNSCVIRNAGFHKARCSRLREGCVRVCVLTLHSTTACGFPLCTWPICLICLPAYFAYRQLLFSLLRSNQGIGRTQTQRVDHYEIKTCWACSAIQYSKLSHYGWVLHTISNVQTHTDTGSNMETYYKQVGFYFYWNTYGLLYSWQLQETYMQSAPATVRLKHAQCIKSKTGKEKKKKQPPQSVHHGIADTLRSSNKS